MIRELTLAPRAVTFTLEAIVRELTLPPNQAAFTLETDRPAGLQYLQTEDDEYLEFEDATPIEMEGMTPLVGLTLPARAFTFTLGE